MAAPTSTHTSKQIVPPEKRLPLTTCELQALIRMPWAENTGSMSLPSGALLRKTLPDNEQMRSLVKRASSRFRRLILVAGSDVPALTRSLALSGI